MFAVKVPVILKSDQEHLSTYVLHRAHVCFPPIFILAAAIESFCVHIRRIPRQSIRVGHSREALRGWTHSGEALLAFVKTAIPSTYNCTVSPRTCFSARSRRPFVSVPFHDLQASSHQTTVTTSSHHPTLLPGPATTDRTVVAQSRRVVAQTLYASPKLFFS